MSKKWKIVKWMDECPECGGNVEVFTDSKDDNMAYDSDLARCTDCKRDGWVSVYGEGDNGAHIEWKDKE